jgi:thioredoxin 1
MRYFPKRCLFVLLFLSIFNQVKSQEANNVIKLNPKEFAAKTDSLSNILILDVRTEEEYKNGHLLNAKNLNIKETSFEKNIKELNKNKPVFVYCLSGGRSANAVKILKEEGFKEIYELEGGILNWRAAQLPEIKNEVNTSKKLSLTEFKKLLNTDKLVLVDYYADWCAPCKKMEPYLKEIEKEMKETVKVIRLNADNHPELMKTLKVKGLPYLHIYKNQKLIWKNEGFIEKDELVKNLNL